jgi:DNA-binding transcriptional LysR family regulator
MRRRIPSTAALICFEAAARHESFTKASAELFLTQGAVCRQIANLEAFLDVRLFRRSKRGVKLTEAGLSYSRRVAAQLDAVERETLAVMGQQGASTLELAVVPTFGTQWLLPRLKDFQRHNPQITVHLTNRTRPFLFADTDFDAAIYFGDGDWPGTQTSRLMEEHPVPVCSPALLQQSTRPYAWRQWFASLDMNVPRDLSGPRYELFSMLAQAAVHEMGIALIPPFLIQRELREGSLVVANAHELTSSKAYYLAVPDRHRELGSLRVFRDWLMQQAQDYHATEGRQHR